MLFLCLPVSTRMNPPVREVQDHNYTSTKSKDISNPKCSVQFVPNKCLGNISMNIRISFSKLNDGQ